MTGTLAATAARLLGEPATLTPLHGGQNSRAYAVVTASGRRAALKAYYRQGGDAADRLAVEYQSLALATAAGLPVPRPLARDDEAGVAVYQWIDGHKPDPHRPGPDVLDAVTAFAAALFALRASRPEACPWPARAACLTPGAILTQIEGRFARLAKAALEHPHGPGLAALLQDVLLPEGARRRSVFEAGCAVAGLDPWAPLPETSLTLSPSDFGLHNALIGADGRLTFLDFEYFGRDDPAKLTADFLLHPAMALSRADRCHFLDGAARAFAGSANYSQRLALLLPLVALKWCAILLNEFLPERLARRTFAVGQGDLARVLDAQLAKAVAMLEHAATVHEELCHG